MLHSEDFARLDAARTDADAELIGRLWTVLRANIGGAHPAPPRWRGGLRNYLSASSERAGAWATYIEAQLRTQIPSKFVVGVQSADFGVLAELLPVRFAALVERSLGGKHERLSVDLLEWLALHEPMQARVWAEEVSGSPHWGVRQCARRILAAS